ncbi:hypothetical protein [Microbacterium aurum]
MRARAAHLRERAELDAERRRQRASSILNLRDRADRNRLVARTLAHRRQLAA